MMGGVIDRVGLADFLRRRELRRQADVGLPDGVRRRTPGLRRGEVAQLAGMSSDYYSRLEQCRGSHPSEPIVAALACALRSDLDERDHLFHRAGLTPPPRRAGRHIRPGLISLVDRLTDVPVWICTDLDEVLWQNTLADAVLGPRDI
jgi:transcriptional regulator with XRE-family HTH domain